MRLSKLIIIQLFSIIFIILFNSINNIAFGGYLKEITGTIQYVKNDNNGHVVGELYTSRKDSGGNYIPTKGQIKVAGGYNCTENFTTNIINGSFNYILGNNTSSCNLDNLQDTQTYTITTLIDTDNDGIVETNGDDYKHDENYTHVIYYDKNQVDTNFIKKTDILDSNGIVKRSSLPYKQGQIIGNNGTIAPCDGPNCDTSYYNIANLTPNNVIKGTLYGVNNSQNGAYDISNLTPENVKKGITFGINQVGNMESGISGTGITQVMAGGLCSGDLITCYMLDYNNDGYQDIIREDSNNLNGKRQLSFFTFFPKGSKYLLNETYLLDRRNSPAVPTYYKDIKFYKGEDFGDPNTYYLSIQVRRGTNDSRICGRRGCHQGNYELIKIQPNLGLINLKSILNKNLPGKIRNSRSIRIKEIEFTYSMKKVFGINAVIMKTDLITLESSSRAKNGEINKDLNYYLIYKGELTVLKNQNGLIYRDFCRQRGKNQINPSTFFLEGFDFNINMPELKNDYPNSIRYFDEKYKLYNYNIITKEKTLLNSNVNFKMNFDDNVRKYRYLIDRGISIKTGSGLYLFKIENVYHNYRYNSSDTLYIFKYNTLTKVFDFINKKGPYTQKTGDNSNCNAYLGAPYLNYGNGILVGPLGYNLSFFDGSVQNIPVNRNRARCYGGYYVSTVRELTDGKYIIGGIGSVYSDDWAKGKYRLYTKNNNQDYVYNYEILSFDYSYTEGSLDEANDKMFGNILTINIKNYSRDICGERNCYNIGYFIYNSPKGNFIHRVQEYNKNFSNLSRKPNYNGTGSIFVYENDLYNSITGDKISGFSYDNSKGYSDNVFNGYIKGNFYLLPEKTTGRNWLYEYDKNTKNLILRSNNVNKTDFGGDSWYIDDIQNSIKYIISISTTWLNKNIIGSFSDVLIFEDKYFHYIGTNVYNINGIRTTVQEIPQNNNERWLGYYYLKNKLNFNFTDYLNSFRDIHNSEGNYILGIKSNTGSIITYIDIQSGFSASNFLPTNSSYLITNNGDYLFTNDAKNINNNNSILYRYEKSSKNNSFFQVWKNKSSGLNILDFYIHNNGSLFLATYKHLFPVTSSFGGGITTYLNNFPNKQQAIDEYKKQKIYFYLNNDGSLADSLNYTYKYNIINGEKFSLEGGSNIIRKNLNDIHQIKNLNNILFIKNTPSEIYYSDKNYFNLKFNTLGTSDYLFGLDSTNFISKTNYYNNFINGTLSNNQTTIPLDKKIYTRTDSLILNQIIPRGNKYDIYLYQGGCGLRGRGDRYNGIVPENKIIKFNDGNKYIVNIYYSTDKYIVNIIGIGSRREICYGYYFYIAENIDNGNIMFIPYYNSTIFDDNGDGTTTIKVKLDNFSDYISIKNYNDYLNIVNNPGLYSSYLNKTFNGRGGFYGDNMFIISNKLHLNYNKDAIDLTNLFNKNLLFSTGSFQAYVDTNYNNNTFSGVVLNDTFRRIPNINFVTDGIYISTKNESGIPKYKINNNNIFTLAQGGTSMSQIYYLGNNNYRVTQSGNNGTDYTNKQIVYKLINGNLVYQYDLIQNQTVTFNYSGVNFTINEIIYKDQFNNTWIEIINSLFPGTSKKKILNKTISGPNLIQLNNSPYIIDKNNSEYLYNAFQNIFIEDNNLFGNYTKVSTDNIFIIKNGNNLVYVLDINGNYKTKSSNNKNNFSEFIYGSNDINYTGGFDSRKIKITDGYLGIFLNKYTNNLINDIIFIENNPFYSSTSITKTLFKYSNNGFENYKYSYNGKNYLSTLNLKNGNFILINHNTTDLPITGNIFSKENGKIYYYYYDSLGKRIIIYTIDNNGNLIVSDIQDSPTLPSINGQEIIIINGLSYFINSSGLLSIIPSDINYTIISQ